MSSGKRLTWLLFLLTMIVAGYGSTATFDPRPSESQARTQLWEKDGLKFTPIRNDLSAYFYYLSGTGSDYPNNGTAYVSFGESAGNLKIERSVNWISFALTSVDLAEYSTVFQGQQFVATFVGYRLDGTTVTQTFTLDGSIDGPGGGADFQTFQFDSGFANLIRVEVQCEGASLDNLVYSLASDPSAQVAPYSVNAGADQRVSLAASANLAGSFVDDGIHLGPTVTSTWTKWFGPGTVTFADPNALQTSATFSEPGKYTLRLTVSDGERHGQDTIEVVVVDPAIEVSLAVTSSTGDPVGQGKSYSYTALDAAFEVGRTETGVKVSLSQNGYYIWSLRFDAPFHGPIGTQQYANAVGAGALTSDRPTLLISRGGNYNSDQIAGAFEVKKVIYGPNRTVEAFWATFTQRVDGNAPLTGEIRFNSTSTATSVNQPPGAYAGVDQQGLTQQIIALAGGSSDDVLSSEDLSYQWTQVEGPATAAFSAPSSRLTNVTCPVGGIYTMRLTVSDGELSKSDDVKLAIRDPKANTLLKYFDGSTTRTFGPVDGDYVVEGDANYIRVQFFPNNYQPWSIEFEAAENGTLAPGFYFCPDYISQTEPRFFFSDGSGIFHGYVSSFTIRELEFGTNGSIIKFTATFEMDGVYYGEVRVNASKNLPEVNYAPVVLAGEDKAIPNRGVALLSGFVTDDKPSNQLKTTWRKASGPGEVAFINPSALYTTATFSQPGTYVLELVADDGSLKTSDQLTVTQTAEVTSLTIRRVPRHVFSFNLSAAEYGYVLTPREGAFSATRDSSFSLESVSVNFSPHSQLTPDWPEWPPIGVDRWSFKLGTPQRDSIQPGAYVGTTRVEGDLGKPFFYFFTDEKFFASSGGFYVHQCEPDPSSGKLKLWITFRIYNLAGDEDIFGEIRYYTDPGPLTGDTPGQEFAVDAGPSETMETDGILKGSVACKRDANDFSFNTRWSVVSGPGLVSFANVVSPGTEVHFSEPGSYVLRLTASSEESTAFSDVAIQVLGGQSISEVVNGSYEGVLISRDNGSNSSGSIVIRVTRTGSFTGYVRLPSGRYPISGSFSGGRGVATIYKNELEALEIELRATAPGQLSGTLIDEYDNVSQVSLAGPARPEETSAGSIGLFSFALLADPNEAADANGFGFLKVGVRGNVRYSLAAPDGTVGSGGGRVRGNGMLPMNVVLPKGKGAFSGLISLRERAIPGDADIRVQIGGNAVWAGRIRDPRTGTVDQFAITYSVVGSRLLPSRFGVAQLPDSRAEYTLEIRNAALDPLIEPLTLSWVKKSLQRDAAPPLSSVKSISINGRTGLFRGTFAHPQNPSKGRFSGILLKDSGLGYGFSFTKFGGFGSVELRPNP